MSNKQFQKGKYVWDPSAWCEKCIAEAMRCIENLPEDFYDEQEPDEEDRKLEDEFFAYKLWQENNSWWSPGARSQQW